MPKPNFEAMSKVELRTYVLAHRDDQEAFQVLADRITSSPSVKYPASMSPTEIQQAVLELLQKKQTTEE